MAKRFRWWHIPIGWAAIIATLFASGVIGFHEGQRYETVKVGGAHGTAVQTLTVPQSAVDQVKKSDVGDHTDMRNESPPAAPTSALEAARAQDEQLAATDQLPIVTPLAAPEQRGCVTRLVQNYSSRQGVRPRIFVLHYTVSPNRTGWSDVNAVVSEFDYVPFQASSNYVIDGEGHCAYIVRESDKAWTQAAMNPVAISVEVIDMGTERTYLAKPGLEKLAMVISDALKRWQIPLQLGAVSGGVVERAGVVDHNMLGLAGGGHHDITPFSVVAVIKAVEKFRASEPDKPTPAQLRKLAAEKRHAALLIKRAGLRKRIETLRAKGETWAQIKTTPLYRQYRNLGGK